MIFVSYAWIDGKPDEEVTNLVAQLRKRGYEVYCDVILAEERTAIDFNRMMKENMQKSKKIIVVLSEEYKKKADSFEGGVVKILIDFIINWMISQNMNFQK